MALTNIQKVRSLIGDLEKAAVQESVVENADGATKKFQLDMFPVKTGTLEVFVSGTLRASATVDESLGVLDFTGATTPTANAQIVATYTYFALSDDEVQNAIDLASGGGNLIAGAIAARSLAGNASRFFAYTQGSKTVNKDNISKKLLDLAKSLEMAHEKAIVQGGTTITVSTFDDSGTHFEGYDTAVAVTITGTAC